MMPALTSQETKQLLAFQTNEITEHHIYHQLSLLQKNENNRRILTELAAEESGHYQLLKTYTQKEVGPKKGKVRFYVWIARLFGLTFSIKLMENSEKYAQEAYRQTHLEDLQKIARDEEIHESRLIELIDEEGLNYMSSVVLGLNDALVEFTGALAGYTFSDRRILASGSVFRPGRMGLRESMATGISRSRMRWETRWCGRIRPGFTTIWKKDARCGCRKASWRATRLKINRLQCRQRRRKSACLRRMRRRRRSRWNAIISIRTGT